MVPWANSQFISIGSAVFGRQVTVRHMLRDRCPVLSVTLVYCGKTVGWIKMPLGSEDVGLGPGHTALIGDPTQPRKGHSSLPLSCLRASLRPYKLGPVSIVAKGLDDSGCHLVRR